MDPNEVLWKVTLTYRDGTKNVYRRLTDKEARRWEKRGLKDPDVAQVEVKVEGR